MISKLVEWLVYALLVGAALWFFNDRIEAHYQAPLIEAHKEAIATQAKANTKASETLGKTKVVIKTVYVDRIKEIETYAKTLPPDSACRASPEFVRLYNSVSR